MLIINSIDPNGDSLSDSDAYGYVFFYGEQYNKFENKLREHIEDMIYCKLNAEVDKVEVDKVEVDKMVNHVLSLFLHIRDERDKKEDSDESEDGKNMVGGGLEDNNMPVDAQAAAAPHGPPSPLASQSGNFNSMFPEADMPVDAQAAAAPHGPPSPLASQSGNFNSMFPEADMPVDAQAAAAPHGPPSPLASQSGSVRSPLKGEEMGGNSDEEGNENDKPVSMNHTHGIPSVIHDTDSIDKNKLCSVINIFVKKIYDCKYMLNNSLCIKPPKNDNTLYMDENSLQTDVSQLLEPEAKGVKGGKKSRKRKKNAPKKTIRKKNKNKKTRVNKRKVKKYTKKRK